MPSVRDVTADPVLGDAVAMASLRAALDAGIGAGDVHRLDDHEVLDLLGPANRGPVLAAPALHDLVLAPAAAPVGPAPASSARPRAAPAPAAPPAPEEGSLGPNVDAAATADALRRASADGVPFCEECERARRAA